ncbi:MAG: hypothetical protein HW421_1950 [Ignavibacteria bacterium]|nr:hypothetical protein [Ignavibacteria bacterium]
MNFRFVGIFLFILYINNYNSNADFTIQLLEGSKYESVDSKNFPFFKIRLKAQRDNNQVSLKSENIVIIENNQLTYKPVVSPPESGWQLITWTSKAKDYLVYNDEITVVAVESGEVAVCQGLHLEVNSSKILIKDVNFNIVNDINFGSKQPGDTSIFQIKLHTLKGKPLPNGEELPIQIDSITTRTPNFKYHWQGNEFYRTPPPVKAIPGYIFLVDLYFLPKDNSFYQDVLTIHYEGGVKEEVNLYGNNFDILSNTLLKLITPNGNESFTPCQQTEIKWKGYSPNAPTYIEFSKDGGFTWEEVGKSNDSTFRWTVPRSYTSLGKIRVNQFFQKKPQIKLPTLGMTVQKISFSGDSRTMLTAHPDGILMQWDVATLTGNITYHLYKDDNAPGTISILGLDWLDDNRFVMAYRLEDNYSQYEQDSLAIFKLGQSEPLSRYALPKGVRTKKFIVDPKKRFFILQPELSPRLSIVSSLDASLMKTINYPVPVGAVDICKSKDTAAVYLLSGEIKLYSIPDFNLIQTLSYPYIPQLLEIALSPDGKLLAAGCKAPYSTALVSNRNEINIIDLKSEQIVRTLRETSSDPIKLIFSPPSAQLLIGSKATPQTALWELSSNNFLGDMGGSTMELTDMAFSPEGHSMAMSANSTYDGLIFREFAYPEQDESDSNFKIILPGTKIEPIKLKPALIATSNQEHFTAPFCNNGTVPIIVDNVKMKNGTHYQVLGSNFAKTIPIGGCEDFDIVFNPLDTGRITDSIVVYCCSGDYYIPVEGVSKNRNLKFFNATYDFGEVCLGRNLQMRVDIIRNEDSVPVIINYIKFFDEANTPFSSLNPLRDITIPPKGTLTWDLVFEPNIYGDDQRKLRVFHSGQSKVTTEMNVKGKGIGSEIAPSTKELLFIPEIPTRKLTIKNISNSNLQISGAEILPTGIFSVTTPLPVDVKMGDSVQLEITWSGTEQKASELSLLATPCIVNNSLRLGFYEATSTIQLPHVTADASGEAVIPINFTTNEPKKYNGIRFFDAEFTINPRLFLPLSVTSSMGRATLVKNEISPTDQRQIQIRVEGDFPANGTVAEIRGIAALAETDTSSIFADISSKFWGINVASKVESGNFRLINLCGNRRFIQDNKAVNILSITPNPADEFIELEFESDSEGESFVELYDMTGILVYSAKLNNTYKGLNKIKLNISGLCNGSYRLLLKKAGGFDTYLIIIMK